MGASRTRPEIGTSMEMAATVEVKACGEASGATPSITPDGAEVGWGAVHIGFVTR